jgi:hypothetical protein
VSRQHQHTGTATPPAAAVAASGPAAGSVVDVGSTAAAVAAARRGGIWMASNRAIHIERLRPLLAPGSKTVRPSLIAPACTLQPTEGGRVSHCLKGCRAPSINLSNLGT